MFKNRVRTAALAGAIAVATGVSGIVVVPANAQPTNPETGTTGSNPQTDNNQNKPDSSKANPGDDRQNVAPVGEVKAADALAKQVERDRAAILKLSPLTNYPEVAEGDYLRDYERPIEEEAQAQAKLDEEAATKLLEQATATLADVNTTLRAVQGQTKAAEDAWKKYATAVTITKSEKDALLDLADALKVSTYQVDGDERYNDLKALIEAIPALATKPGSSDYVADVQNIREESIEAILEFDKTARYYIETRNRTENDIDASNAASTLYDALNDYLEGWDDRDKLYREALKLTSTATSRNIVTLEKAAAQARAQVRALRLIQAYFGFSVRWLDLYENDTLRDNEETTLRKEYLDQTVELLNQANVALEELAGAGKYAATQKTFDRAGTVKFWNRVAPLDSWENEAQRVRLLDKKYRTDAEAEAAAKEAEKAEKDAIKASIDSIAESLAALAAGKKGNEGSDGNDGKDGNDGSDDNNSGNTDVDVDVRTGKLSPAAIAGIVLGVVVALGGIVAVAFPQIQHLLPKF